MRTTNRFLGLGLVSTMFVLSACADDGDSDSSDSGADTTTPSTSSTTSPTSGSSDSSVPTTGTTDASTSGSDTTSTTGPTTSDTSATSGPTTGSTSGEGTESTTETTDTTADETAESSTSGDEGSTTTETGDEGSTTTTETGDDTDTTDTTTGTETGTDTGPNYDLLEDLTDAVCEWAYNCCEQGELDYIIGPFVKDESECSERLFHLLTVSNDNTADKNELKLKNLGNSYRALPFHLAYRVHMERSTTIDSGIENCIQAWREDDCREPAEDHPDNCEEDPVERACQLDKLFEGVVPQGGFCNWELVGPHTDIECVYGTTCEAISDRDVDDPQNYRCVYKGQEGDRCTVPNFHDDTLQSGRGNGSCEWGLYCDKESGKCRERPGVGDTCEYDSEENPRVDQMRIPCGHDLYCDPKTDKCVDECTEGYGCGPRAAAGTFVNRGRTDGFQEDRLIQWPTENNRSPADVDDTCGSELSCVPHRNDPKGDEDAEKPGDAGYYFGKGTDRYGTSFECRSPGRVNALCDTKSDCREGYYCKKKVVTRDDSANAHQHDGADGDGFFADVGTCALELRPGDECWEGPDAFVDVDLRSDLFYSLLEEADDRCPIGYFCDLQGLGTEGSCQEKLQVNDECHRHDECDDQNGGLGLCLATNDGISDELGDARKRCAKELIQRGKLCAPRAGLGSNAPFPIVLRDPDEASAADDFDAPGHNMLEYEIDPDPDATAPATPGDHPVGYLEVTFATGVTDDGFPNFWNGSTFPAANPVSGQIFESRKFTRMGANDLVRAAVGSNSGDEFVPFANGGGGGTAHPADMAMSTLDAFDGWSDGPAHAMGSAAVHYFWFWGYPSDHPANLPDGDPGHAMIMDEQPHPFGPTGVDISGGEYHPHKWMQGQAMVLRDDLKEWERVNSVGGATRKISYNPNDPDPMMVGPKFAKLDDETTRSDFRHLASHCDPNRGLVCQRDKNNSDSGGHPFRCLTGVPEGQPCDADPGTFGQGRGTCMPGYECSKNNKCVKHLATGDTSCEPDDTGDDSHKLTTRCDWHHRAPEYKAVPCPSRPTGSSIQCEDGELIDPLTGDPVMYVYKYDNGCEEVHRTQMCRLITEDAHDMAYCDGTDTDGGRYGNNN